MSLLNGIITQVITNAVGNNTANTQNQGGLGGILGSVLGGQSQQNSGLGGVLGNVLASQLGNNTSNSALGGILGSVLGGQSQQNSGLGGVLGSMLGGQSQSQNQSGGLDKSTLLLALLPIVLGFIQSSGGLSGVLDKIKGSGLGNQAQSWVNIDTNNDGIDAGDVIRLFGQDTINNACQQTGASQNQVCQGIAELLPQVVNDLTPTGNLNDSEQAANQEISDILTQLQKVL